MTEQVEALQDNSCDWIADWYKGITSPNALERVCKHYHVCLAQLKVDSTPDVLDENDVSNKSVKSKKEKTKKKSNKEGKSKKEKQKTQQLMKGCGKFQKKAEKLAKNGDFTLPESFPFPPPSWQSKEPTSTTTSSTSTATMSTTSTTTKTTTPIETSSTELTTSTTEVSITSSIAMLDFSATIFNAPTGPLCFRLSDGEFADAELAMLSINTAAIDNNLMEVNDIDSSLLVVDRDLNIGRNSIYLQASDNLGHILIFEETLWAGQLDVEVNILDANSNLLKEEETKVILYLPEAPDVVNEIITNDGKALFSNVPDRTFIVDATCTDGSFGSSGGVPSDGVILVKLASFYPPSIVKNLDFSLDSDGWEVETDPASVFVEAHHYETASTSRRLTVPQDFDLVLTTVEEGEQHVHHQFELPPGIWVKIQYRFQTNEVPVYFNTQYNDYFAISIRKQIASGIIQIASEENSMNGLGLEAFLPGGYTDWRDIVIAACNEPSLIQVDVRVANVGDGAVDSKVIIDFILEGNSMVSPSLAWDGVNGGISLHYEVLSDVPLVVDEVIHLHWADVGKNTIGDPFFTEFVHAGTAPGPYKVNVQLDRLAPSKVSLIRASSGKNYFYLPDAKVMKGVNADFTVVTPLMFEVIKGGLRNAGQPHATISSTTRSPEDQARVMFDNLVNPVNTVSINIQNQLDIYGSAGDQVIVVFQNLAVGKTRDEILQSRASIETAMVNKINGLGPQTVSSHCADPKSHCVVDVEANTLPKSKGERFLNFVGVLISSFEGGKCLDESDTNGCIHLELDTEAQSSSPHSPPSCVTIDGREGTCINRKSCLLSNMDPVAATSSSDPKPNCWNFAEEIQCCAEIKLESPPPTICSQISNPFDPVGYTTKPGEDYGSYPSLSLEASNPFNFVFIEYMKEAEGYVGSYPYASLEGGNPTVGYGHKLSDEEVTNGTFESGLTKKEAEELLIQDIQLRIPQAIEVYENIHGAGAFQAASTWGKRMLVDKVFLAGKGGLSEFVKMMKAINENDAEVAKKEMLTSYVNTNGVRAWDYGRRDKFIKYCMVDCDEVPAIIDCNHLLDGFWGNNVCYEKEATKPFCFQNNQCSPCFEHPDIADKLCAELAANLNLDTIFCDRLSGSCTSSEGLPRKYESRSMWGADDWYWGSKYSCGVKVTPNIGSFSPMSQPDRITIHHTAQSQLGNVLDIQRYHQKILDWCDIGYNFLVDYKGTVYQGRPFQDDIEFGGEQKNELPPPDELKLIQGAHVTGHNSNNIGIALIGCFQPSEECAGKEMNLAPGTPQYEGLIRILAYLCEAFNINPSATTILPHRYFGGSSCPGDNVVSILGGIINDTLNMVA